MLELLSLEGGSNEYPQSMFRSKKKEEEVYPCIPQFQFLLYKSGVKWVQVGKDQETAQSEKDSHSKNRDGKKLN